MHDWLAMALFALGLGLIVSAVFKRRSRLRSVVPAGAMRPEYAAMGEVVRPLVLFFIAILALKMSLFYFLLGGQRYLTAAQYSGVLFMLATYAGWLVAATTKRPVQAPDEAPEELAPAELVDGMRSAA